MAYEYDLHPKVVRSKLHYHTGATREFYPAFSPGPMGIILAQMAKNPTLSKIVLFPSSIFFGPPMLHLLLVTVCFGIAYEKGLCGLIIWD